MFAKFLTGKYRARKHRQCLLKVNQMVLNLTISGPELSGLYYHVLPIVNLGVWEMLGHLRIGGMSIGSLDENKSIKRLSKQFQIKKVMSPTSQLAMG